MSLAQKIIHSPPAESEAVAKPVKGGRPTLTRLKQENGRWVPDGPWLPSAPKLPNKSEGALVAKTTAAGEMMPPKHDRAARLAAAREMIALWKESGNGPTDGVEYQNRMRAEWQ
ncbi:hypothetical protein [Duganella sp. FT27W]|uniref:hypothetical protein n=1 Tax=Duganella sp. FT27W TaxID=2654636 RepID=UPI00128BFEBA|nr:hypothetical protein [Duganella sp. FT27W]MPQ56275.1 hypothetical protein [Duganella sp. FT27W]